MHGGRGRGRGTNPTWGSIPAPLDQDLSGSQLLHGTPPPFMFILQQGKHKGEGHLKGQRAKKVRDKSKRRNPGKNYGKEPEAARGEEETPGRTVKGESATCRSLAAFSGTPATAAPAHLSSCRHRAPTLGAEQTPHPGNRHQPKDP